MSFFAAFFIPALCSHFVNATEMLEQATQYNAAPFMETVLPLLILFIALAASSFSFYTYRKFAGNTRDRPFVQPTSGGLLPVTDSSRRAMHTGTLAARFRHPHEKKVLLTRFNLKELRQLRMLQYKARRVLHLSLFQPSLLPKGTPILINGRYVEPYTVTKNVLYRLFLAAGFIRAPSYVASRYLVDRRSVIVRRHVGVGASLEPCSNNSPIPVKFQDIVEGCANIAPDILDSPELAECGASNTLEDADLESLVKCGSIVTPCSPESEDSGEYHIARAARLAEFPKPVERVSLSAESSIASDDVVNHHRVITISSIESQAAEEESHVTDGLCSDELVKDSFINDSAPIYSQYIEENCIINPSRSAASHDPVQHSNNTLTGLSADRSDECHSSIARNSTDCQAIEKCIDITAQSPTQFQGRVESISTTAPNCESTISALPSIEKQDVQEQVTVVDRTRRSAYLKNVLLLHPILQRFVIFETTEQHFDNGLASMKAAETLASEAKSTTEPMGAHGYESVFSDVLGSIYDDDSFSSHMLYSQLLQQTQENTAVSHCHEAESVTSIPVPTETVEVARPGTRGTTRLRSKIAKYVYLTQPFSTFF